jgi:hypothetical protein
MTRLNRLESKGWKVSQSMNSNSMFATKNNGLTKVKGTSITDLHKKIFGY